MRHFALPLLVVANASIAATPAGTAYLPPGTACEASTLYQVKWEGSAEWVCDVNDALGFPVYRWLPGSGGDPTILPGTYLPDGSFYIGGGLIASASDAPGLYASGCGTAGYHQSDADTGANSDTDGRANTETALGGAPYCDPIHMEAQRYCHHLTAHGHSDWYLPANSQLLALFNVAGVLGMSGSYWSSTEVYTTLDNMNMQGNVADGRTWHEGRNYGKKVRCVRG
ncbi:Lcl C-terminal domain-containing protein [Endothiovibrio diazotrophicus]